MKVVIALIFGWILGTSHGKPKPESSLAPGPFGALDNVKPPRPSTNDPVLIPPDIKYWAYGKVNTTVVDGKTGSKLLKWVVFGLFWMLTLSLVMISSASMYLQQSKFDQYGQF